MSTQPSKADQLEKRLIAFSAAIVSLSSKLPRTPQGRHICGQILRSGTAASANYGEARGAESRADFIHKLKLVFKELNETTIWLDIVAQSSLLPAEAPRTEVSYSRNQLHISSLCFHDIVVEIMIARIRKVYVQVTRAGPALQVHGKLA